MRSKRRAFFPAIEDKLVQETNEIRSRGGVVTGNFLVIRSKQIAQELGIENFMGKLFLI